MNDQENFLKKTFQYAWRHSVLFSRFILICLVVLYTFSGIFSVSSNEIGIHQRFGRIINEKVQPGIHYKLPWPIDKVIKVPVRIVKRMVIDDFYFSRSLKSKPSEQARLFAYMTGLDSYCISGDNNLVIVKCIIQYTITNPFEYLFCIKDPDIMLRSLACKTIIHCMAKMHIDDILTRGKQSVASYIRLELQEKLDQGRTGINISFVELSNIEPPGRVESHFSDVVKASIDREKMINDSESYRNEIISQAKADAAAIIEKAGGYKSEVVLHAEGKTNRFNRLLERAQENESHTRQMIYLESIKEIMGNVGSKHIIGTDKEGQKIVNLKLKAQQ